MITAIFNPDSTTANACGLWQYDYGQTLRIQGLHLPSMVEIHFSLQETGGIAPTRVGVTKDGVTDVVIPDSMLENDGATSDYDIFAFIYLTDDTSGQTEYKIKLKVKSRPEPEVPGGGEDPDIFHDAVRKVKESADKAAESERQAEGWAHGREDLPERAEDNAKYYAGQTAEDAAQTAEDRKEVKRLVESVSGIDEQVAKVENLTKQAQTSATNAALSEQAAKTAEINAQEAQAGAETAEGNAELAERGAKVSEQAVEKAKQLVTQMEQDVLNNKNYVDQAVQEFALTTQQALADVNNAGQAQTERVQGAGNTAVESVKTAQGTATQAVETAKSEAVQAVQTEGTAQTGNVTAEGEKQVQAVETAAQEIIADREQIKTNKADIADLRQNKAGAVVETVSGEMIQVKDSSGAAFEEMRIFGKSTQVTTTGANLLDVSLIPDRTLGENIIRKTEDNGIYVEAKTDDKFFATTIVKINLPPGSYYVSDENGDAKCSFYVKITRSDAVDYIQNRNFQVIEGDTIDVYIQVDPNQTVKTTLYPMVTSGNSKKPYEPYTGGFPSPSIEYPQEIENSGDSGEIGVDVSGSNLFDVSKIEDTWNGRYGIKNNNGVLTMTSASSDSTITTRKTMKELCPQLKVGETYVFSANNSGTRKAIYLYNLGLYEYDNPIVITNEILNSELRFYISGKVNDSGTIKNIQVNKGKAALPYEPYRPLQQLTIPTPNGLPGIKVDSGGNYTDSTGQQWVCDEIDLARGKYVQRIGKYTFDGMERYSDDWLPTITATMRNDGITGNVSYGNAILSNCGELAYSNSSGRAFGFKTSKWGVSGYEELKMTMKNKYDSGVPVLAQYPLATPIETDLPPEVIEAYKQLHTNYPTTVVTNDSDARMEAGYVADTKNYIKNNFAPKTVYTDILNRIEALESNALKEV